MKKELPKVYEPREVEGRVYEMWEKNGCFEGRRDPDKRPFTIVMPPPNVTGQLHMGHAMDCTLQDILIRFKRMQGYAALWVPGTDHAGIATQIKVEEELRVKEGLTRYALGREIYQAVTFLSLEQEHLLLDRAPHLKTTRWHPNFLDVIPPIGGKDLGMDAILDHFGIPVENCMAFGDGENDLSMLVHAGIGVAMGTASDAVKAQADYAAPSVDEDGIAHTLSHFGLIP